MKRGQDVWVKVISTAGQKISLSMRDVDQATGADLLPGARSEAEGVNPAKPAAGPAGNNSLRGLSGIRVSDEPVAARRPGKRLTSPERWEVTQLIKAGVLSITEYPTFDEEGQARLRGHAVSQLWYSSRHLFKRVLSAVHPKALSGLHDGASLAPTVPRCPGRAS